MQTSLSQTRVFSGPTGPTGSTVPTGSLGLLGSVGVDISSILSSWWATILVVILLVIVFAVYYQTIGYYFKLGWDRLSWSKSKNEKVEITTPTGGPTAILTPAPAHSEGEGAGASIGKSFSNVANKIESDVEAALGVATGGKKQVFNVARNVYTFAEAEPLCRAFGAELATYDQVKEAYNAGADWCNYGWAKGQLALYPTQKSTYEKLQAGPEKERMMCGLPGVNGGFFPNESQRFGVNCYGPRPAETALDQREETAENSDITFDREVNRFRSELNSISVKPFSSNSWSA